MTRNISPFFSKRGESSGWKKLAFSVNHVVCSGPVPSIHAEDNAISKFTRMNKSRNVLKRHEKIDIVVIRLSRQGVLGYSRPCKNCIKRLIISDFLINNVYYSTADGAIQVERFSTMYESSLTVFSMGDTRRMRGYLYNATQKNR